MLKSWIITVVASLVVSLAAVGVLAVDGDPITAHKIDCQSALETLSALQPTHQPVVYNKSTQCGFTY